MYRPLPSSAAVGIESPHKRGDVPSALFVENHIAKISPQAWGCTGGETMKVRKIGNLPTSVGMYRTDWTTMFWSLQSPHKRGDVPRTYPSKSCCVSISPQAWGCTAIPKMCKLHNLNLPTSVGMYRVELPSRGATAESPHKRGDVPIPPRCGGRLKSNLPTSRGDVP